jgi:hypothetical protein
MVNNTLFKHVICSGFYYISYRENGILNSYRLKINKTVIRDIFKTAVYRV